MRLNVNGEAREVDLAPDTPLLWALRDALGLTGVKYGCGVALCGACTVHVDGAPERSCQLLLEDVADAAIVTIEGLAASIGAAEGAHPVQTAWIVAQVPQCGYCQSGQIMSAAALLAETPDPSDAEIDAALSGNLCRCGAYPRIRRAVKAAARAARG